MKANLLPMFFAEMNDDERQKFADRLALLRRLYNHEAVFLAPCPVGSAVPADTDAIVFPLMMYGAYRHDDFFSGLKRPVIVLTSEQGTMEMWDWEIVTYLRSRGCQVFSPYSENLAKVVMRALAAKRSLNEGAQFVIYQETPGDAIRPDIFKRFYWYEKSAIETVEAAFGCKLIYRSWKAVCDRAQAIPDCVAETAAADLRIPVDASVPHNHFLRAIKLYLAVCEDIDTIPGHIAGVSANCMNEANLCDTTPCLAWNLLFEKRNITWACEGDIMTMLSIYILWHSLHTPLMMTNIYPFLSGLCALKHEKIDRFPDVADPDNCALAAHCGYFGFTPLTFCRPDKWCMRNKVLSVTPPTAMALDCEFEPGPVTICKLFPDFNHMNLIPAAIESYVQYPNSHCLNGAILRYANGHDVMEELCSHHVILLEGSVSPECTQVAKVFGFQLVKI